jgi:hypothetical protein
LVPFSQFSVPMMPSAHSHVRFLTRCDQREPASTARMMADTMFLE